MNSAAVIAELTPLLRQMLKGRYAIALAGSHAKGQSDQHSDLDFYLFADEVLDVFAREAILLPHTDDPASMYLGGDPDTAWGVCTDFEFAGLRVEASTRSIALVERVLAECLAGEIHVEPAAWTHRGYYYFCYLSDLNIAKILDDPCGLLAGWKQRIALYPPLLKESIITSFLGMACAWPDNFHYISAIQRNDIPYVTGIVQQIAHNLVQVLFAMNEVYYSGEKNLLPALRGLTYTPPDFERGLLTLLYPPQEAGVFEQQRQIIKGFIADIQSHLK